jgi:hypothetical protein
VYFVRSIWVFNQSTIKKVVGVFIAFSLRRFIGVTLYEYPAGRHPRHRLLACC